MATPGRTGAETAATEVEGKHVSEIPDANLRSPWSDGPLHELPAKDVKELASNAPAAQEAVAEDWRIVPRSG
jgi:hypothetical protein